MESEKVNFKKVVEFGNAHSLEEEFNTFQVKIQWMINKQAGAELDQAQPELGFEENDLSLRGYILVGSWIAMGLK